MQNSCFLLFCKSSAVTAGTDPAAAGNKDSDLHTVSDSSRGSGLHL